MSLGHVLLDTAVFVYAVGADHPYREPCVALLRSMGQGSFRGDANVLVIQELAHQRSRATGDRQAAQRTATDAAATCTVHDVTEADLALGLRLFAGTTGLHAADALHAATALTRGIPVIVSPDDAFDEVTGIARIDPVDAAAQLSA